VALGSYVDRRHWNGWTPRDPSQGNAWENQALFDYDELPLPALHEFRP
jgi:arabinogalactan endo-1,4-beta-galactosidase